jgi:pimeloyl-ACP methyl ester carboxylesterase
MVRTRDGREIHVERHGQGGPVVVLEAGMGASRCSWGAVVPGVAERTTAVVYDRSGLGRSPADPAPRRLDRLVDDLVDVLGGLGDGPFVLVGHSWGGPIVRGAAARVPDRIAGLVLVDATDEGCDLILTRRNERAERWMRPVMPILTRLGLVRWMVRRLAASLPEPAATDMVAEDTTPAAMRAYQAEVAGSIADLRHLRDHPEPLPDVPLTVISGGSAGPMGRKRRDALIAAHQARAASATQGRHVIAPDSGHYVPFTDPALITTEILRLVTPDAR